MPQLAPSMTTRTLSGLFWMSLATGANVISLLVVLVILAHFLTPADFGLATAALMVIGFSAVFSEFGIGPALVQRPDLRPAHLHTGFTLSVLLGLVVATLIWVTAPDVADFFHLDELTPILRTLALIFPVQALGVVADSLLQRELRFRTLAVLDIVTVVLGYGAVGVTLAVLGFGPWALVAAHVAQMVLKTALLLCLRLPPAWPSVERRACAELLYFGGGFTASRFSNYLAGQGEHLVIGRYLGSVALGVYGRAYQLMAAPAVLFGNVLDRVLFPAMVHVQHQPERLGEGYRRGSALIALVILPISVGMIVLAPELTGVVLGSDWEEVVLPLQILGIGMLFRTGCKISDSLVRATGAVYRRTWRQAAYAVAVIVGALIGRNWGVEGVAVAVLATLAVNFFLMAHLALGLAGMTWRTFAAAHVPGLALATLVGILVAVAAESLRAWGAAPAVVLVGASAAALPCLLVVRWLPDLFLGPDGRWMARKLRGFCFPAAPPQPPVPAPLSSACPGTNGVAAHARNGTNGTGLRHAPLPCEETADSPLRLLALGLAAERVRYCRWKRRLDLSRVLSGAGDLDLLVDRKDADRFLRVAAGLGFKRALPCHAPPRPHEEHLFAPDPVTGSLLHLHVNYALAEPGGILEGIGPDLDELVLSHAESWAVPGPLEGMPVVEAQAEVIAAVLLALERYTRLCGLASLLRRQRDVQAKLQAVLAADPAEGWRGLLGRWLPAVPPALFAECVTALRGRTSWWRRFRLARRLLGHLPTGSSLASPVQRLTGLFRAAWWRLRHGRGSPKGLPSGGAVIAFVGPDASGKSTMVAETARWLGQVFRVETAHLGKPPSAWLTLVPNLLGRLLRVVAPRLRTTRAEVTGESKAGRQGLLYRIRAVLLAWDRRAFARRLAQKAARGWLVVCDRYPSADIGAADSARLRAPEDEPGQTWLRAFLARLENRLYRGVPGPDIVVRLTTPLAVAIDRNAVREKAGKESADFVTRRHKTFLMPAFPRAQVMELDTLASQAETLQRLRRLVWGALGSRPRGARRVLTAARGACCTGAGEVCRYRKRPLVVEFIGATGVGKSTLMAAVAECLAAQGVRVCEAEELTLAHYGLTFCRNRKVRSALVHLLALRSCWRYFFTRDGFRLWQLALASIRRGMGNVRTGATLLRNFCKRTGFHLLLEKLRGDLSGCDIVLCDEGVVHAAHNLFVHTNAAPKDQDVVEFGRVVPRPDLLVWVTAPPVQSAGVILRRGHSRVRGTTAAARTFAEHAHATFEILASVAGVQEILCKVDNSHADGPADATIRARACGIGEMLKQHLRTRQERRLPGRGALPRLPVETIEVQ